MKRDTKKLIGSYGRWDATRIEVYVDPNDNGGSGGISPEGIHFMTVGLDLENWAEVFDVCLHEMLEIELVELGTAYRTETRMDCVSTRDRIFLLSHTDFSEAVVRSSATLTRILPDLADAFNKRKKAKK